MKDCKYLDQVLKIFNRMKNDLYMFEDLIFYWDMDVFNIFNEFWDVFFVFCIVFVLYEISIYVVFDVVFYKVYVDCIMYSFVLFDYWVVLGINGNFILMYSVGSILYNSEIDVFLNYVDYYFLEVLKCRKDLDK